MSISGVCPLDVSEQSFAVMPGARKRSASALVSAAALDTGRRDIRPPPRSVNPALFANPHTKAATLLHRFWGRRKESLPRPHRGVQAEFKTRFRTAPGTGRR